MTNLSDVFKYISHFRHAGHQVGRKVGDMLEVLTYAAIARDNNLLSRLQVEPKLYGYSDAGHKVEFVLLNQQNLDDKGNPVVINGGEIKNLGGVIGFIECKKVGVEQTVNGTFKRNFEKNGNNRNYKIPYGEEFSISFAPRGQERHSYNIVLDSNRTIQISKIEDNTYDFNEPISENYRVIFALDDCNEAIVLGNEQSLREFPGTLQNCRILDIYSCENEYALALLNDCLAGPQTPEKAKQSSFVALDVRKRRFDSFDIRPDENELISVLVMTEFSHWEAKSQNIIKACIDRNFVVDDQKIVEAFQAFEDNFGGDFYGYITKEQFENNKEVRQIAIDIVEKYDGLIFLDIEDRNMKKIEIENGTMVFTS